MRAALTARLVFFVAVLVAILSFVAQPTMAQLSGFNIKGDMGLKSGSQAPPGGYVALLFYHYGSDTIKDRFGNTVATSGDISIGAGAALFNLVTTKKFLGANYGFVVAPLVFMNTAIESPRFGLNPSPGFGDIFIMPISLGWHLKRADVTTSYSIFMPTGRYSVGANDNTSLDMWGHEWALGTTVYLTENKAWHVATNMALEFHTGKRHSAAKVGSLLTLEGGLGRDVLKGAGSIGVAYYSQWKISSDTLTGLPALLVSGKNRSFAIGPEINLPLVARKTLFGFVTFRYQFETYARTALQGNALTLMTTFLLKPINLAPPPPPANRAPSVSCSAAMSSVYAGSAETVAVSATGSDPDGDSLTYAWSTSGGRVEGAGASVRWNSTGLAAGNYRVSAQASDGKGGTSSCDAEIRVEPKPNASPTMSCSMERSSVLSGERVRVNVRAADADNDPLTYTWSASAGHIVGSGDTVQFDATGLRAGRYTVTGRVDDGRGGATDCSASLNVTEPPPPPQASKLNECLFRTGSARVDNVCKRILDDVAIRLNAEPNATVVLVGYADPKESKTLNSTRAAAAAKYLGDKGVSAGRINQRSATGQAGADKQNRRVDVVWVPAGATF
ncbi:MAG: transporter [Acidobacteria bacterium]|nr:transporter [Acidobacteriota bacterium]MBI3485216.1 transporter [Acidobacteriota bacterium]